MVGPGRRMAGPVPDGAPEPVPSRFARLFVASLLLLVVGSPMLSLNLWPFSSWNLFSGIRTDEQTTWSLVAVDPSGAEHDLPVESLGRQARSLAPVIRVFDRSSGTDRAALCAAWFGAAEVSLGRPAVAVRIVRSTWRLSERRAGKGTAARTSLWTCAQDGVHAGG